MKPRLGRRGAGSSDPAGWAPQAIRTGIVIPSAQRPIQVLDVLRTGDTLMNAVLFMEETTATSGAAEMAEGGAYARPPKHDHHHDHTHDCGHDHGHHGS